MSRLRIGGRAALACGVALVVLVSGRVVAATRPAVGDAAPDFALPASTGKTIRLADFRGKKRVVLAFFPKAFTAG